MNSCPNEHLLECTLVRMYTYPNEHLSECTGLLRSWASAEGGRGAVRPLDFHNDTDKVVGGLMVLRFGLVFSVGFPPAENFSADAFA